MFYCKPYVFNAWTLPVPMFAMNVLVSCWHSVYCDLGAHIPRNYYRADIIVECNRMWSMLMDTRPSISFQKSSVMLDRKRYFWHTTLTHASMCNRGSCVCWCYHIYICYLNCINFGGHSRRIYFHNRSNYSWYS